MSSYPRLFSYYFVNFKVGIFYIAHTLLLKDAQANIFHERSIETVKGLCAYPTIFLFRVFS